MATLLSRDQLSFSLNNVVYFSYNCLYHFTHIMVVYINLLNLLLIASLVINEIIALSSQYISTSPSGIPIFEILNKEFYPNCLSAVVLHATCSTSIVCLNSRDFFCLTMKPLHLQRETCGHLQISIITISNEILIKITIYFKLS